VPRATVGGLARYLSPEVPWVWILGHVPNATVEWWTTDVPLNRQGVRLQAQVRLMTYDFQLPTPVFLRRALDLEDHGVRLVQSRLPMPNTLELSRLTEPQLSRVLRLNGAFLYIELPHAVETALVRCFEPGYLAQFSGT
jgi:hypothetical protein